MPVGYTVGCQGAELSERVLVSSCSYRTESVLPEHIDLLSFCSHVLVSIYSIRVILGGNICASLPAAPRTPHTTPPRPPARNRVPLLHPPLPPCLPWRRTMARSTLPLQWHDMPAGHRWYCSNFHVADHGNFECLNSVLVNRN